MINKENTFQTELTYIHNQRIKESTKTMILLLPDYFFEIAASSTGKYHPNYALGQGGLVRHTKAAVRIAYELLQDPIFSSPFTEDEQDLIIMALILHDGCKLGLPETPYTVVKHPLLISNLIKNHQDTLTLNPSEIELVTSMIDSHMGPWNKDYQGRTVLPVPNNKYQKFVHLCDYLASRKVIEIPFKENEIQ